MVSLSGGYAWAPPAEMGSHTKEPGPIPAKPGSTACECKLALIFFKTAVLNLGCTLGSPRELQKLLVPGSQAQRYCFNWSGERPEHPEFSTLPKENSLRNYELIYIVQSENRCSKDPWRSEGEQARRKTRRPRGPESPGVGQVLRRGQRAQHKGDIRE